MGVVEVRVELEVSLILAAVAATLVGAVVPGSPAELDVLNDPSARAVPGGLTELGDRCEHYKGSTETSPNAGRIRLRPKRNQAKSFVAPVVQHYVTADSPQPPRRELGTRYIQPGPGFIQSATMPVAATIVGVQKADMMSASRPLRPCARRRRSLAQPR